MKFKDLLDENYLQMRNWHKELRKEFNKSDINSKEKMSKEKVEVITSNFNWFYNEAKEVMESYRTLNRHGLLSDKTVLKYEIEYQKFVDETFNMRSNVLTINQIQ